jgi:Fe-S-cluster-containing dehydrogenase component
VNAISKREDGMVVIDEEACTGCKLCVYGCPYGSIFFNEMKPKNQKFQVSVIIAVERFIRELMILQKQSVNV